MSAPAVQSRFPNVTAVDTARTQLLDEISYHSQETLRLKTLLNSRQAISQLPPEILLHIFLLQAEDFQQETLLRWSDAREFTSKPPEHKPLYTWISVALVCRSWRELALNYAPLWACQVLDERVPAAWVRTILARAQSVPLTVVVHAVSNTHCSGCMPYGRAERNDRDALGLLSEMLPATRRLAVFIGKRDYEGVFDALCSPAPQLDWLHIEGIKEYGAHPALYGLDGPAVPLWRNLFSPRTGVPPLRSLSLATVQFDWDSALILPTLRHLKVIRQLSDDEDLQPSLAISLSRSLDVLRGLPQLESLQLDHTTMPKYDPAAQHDPVTLPHLRLLYLSLASADTAHLLTHLNFPKTTTVHLEMPPKFRNPFAPKIELEQAAIEAQQKFIVSALEGLAVLGITTYLPRSLFYEAPLGRSPCCIWAENVSSGDSPPAFPPSWAPVAQRSPRLVVESPLGGPLLDGAFAEIDLRHLRFLSISKCPESPPRWAETLQRAENLTTLRISGTMAFGLGAALVGWTRPTPADEDDPAPGAPRPPKSWVGFAEALRFAADPRARADEDEDTSGVLCVRFPRLRVLRIARVDFRLTRPLASGTRWRYHSHMKALMYEGSGTPYGLDDEGLARSLRLRVEHGGARLDRLEFVDCQCVERERLVALLGAVSELWWDEKRLTEADLPVQMLAHA